MTHNKWLARAIAATAMLVVAGVVGTGQAQTTGPAGKRLTAVQIEAVQIGRFMSCAGSYDLDMDAFREQVMARYQNDGKSAEERNQLGILIDQGRSEGSPKPEENVLCGKRNKATIKWMMNKILNPTP